MKAAIYEGNKTFGLGEGQAIAPGPGEVRIKVAYCGICGTDLHIYQGHMDGRVGIPQVIGHEMSGEIVELGEGVTGWQVGDLLTVRPLAPCGTCPACEAGHSHICLNLNFIGIDTPGAFQGSWTVPAYSLHRLPEGVPLDKAAMIEPVAVACHDVRLGEVQAGEQVVVIGGGPIGMLNALAARHLGAQVLISEVNPFRVDLARELGLDAVNPREVDLKALVEERTGGAGADVVMEVSGSQAGASVMTELVRTRGRIVIVAIFAFKPEVDLKGLLWREIKMVGVRVYEPQDFEQAIQLVADEVLPLDALITARYPLSGLQTAFEQIESGAEVMKILINTQEA
jgi:(R,R)-butanediol dehydrogenase/meso-butanediol dehydrogenase/diacetyl reductase